MAKIERWYQTAFERQNAGDLDAAEPLYRRVLEKQPRHVEALYLLGSLYAQQGRYAQALPFLERALALRPHFTEAQNNRAVALKELGRLDEALACYDAALALRPDYAEAHNNRGMTLQNLGRWEEALESFRQAHAVKPEYIEPLNNLGILLKDKGRLAESEAAFRQALAVCPTATDPLNNLGLTLMAQARFEEAIACHDAALALKPDFPQGYNSRGASLVALGRFDEAREGYRRALLLKHDYTDARCNIALSYLSENRIDEALTAFDDVLAQDPDVLSARWNRSLTLLVGGDLARGWAEYECRFRHNRVATHGSTKPLWGGSPLAGHTILVHAEQGLGDTLHFVRYLPLVKAAGGRVLFECPPALHPLLAACDGVDALLAAPAPGTDHAEPYDVQIPLLSLPGLFGTTEENIPGDVPYVTVPADKGEEWRARIDTIRRSLPGGGQGLKVGLVWGGSPNHSNDHNRSCPLAEFGPLAAASGVTFWSLQKGPAASQAADAPFGMTLVDLGPALADFADTAAAVAQMDLVISVDTSVVHLAGALGKPVWTLLPFCPDWRWQLGREDSPWYPTMRLFRQVRPKQWTPVLHRVGDELSRLAAHSTAGEEEAACLIHLGETHFAAGDRAEARRCFEQALTIAPGHARARNDLAVLAFGEGRYDDAIVLLDVLLSEDPGLTSAAENMARCWEAKGKDAQAVVWWQKALQASPQEPALWNALAQCGVRIQEWAAARDAFRESLRLDDSQDAIRAILAELDVALGAEGPRVQDATPLVSIITPCYKQAHLLPEAIASVVAQTYTNWELIVVNDGSPDDTSAVAHALIAAHPERRIRLINKANGGLSAARNTGLQAITGSLVLPLDADDTLHPRMLEKCVAALEAHPEASVAYTHIRLFGTQTGVSPCGPFRLDAETETNRLAYCSLMRRPMVEALNGYAEDAVAYEDWDFWLRAMTQGHEGVLVPEPLFQYRQSAASKLAQDNLRRDYFVAQMVLRHPELYGPARCADAARTVASHGGAAERTQAGPLVSVILPCYKQAQYLPDAIASLCDQTYAHWEAVIVNDGSPDDTSAVARALIAAHPDRHIRLVEKSNGGLSSARNAGIRASAGPLVLPLDADDALHPRMLEKCVAALETHPQDAVAFTHVQHFGAQTDVWQAGPFTPDAMAETNRLVCTALFRREVFDAVGGFAEDLLAYEDWDFWLSAIERGATGRLVPEALFRYRKALSSMLTGANARRARLTAHITTRHPKLYGPAKVAQAKAGLTQWAAEDARREDALALFADGPGPRPRVLIAAAFFHPHVGGEERFAEDLAVRLQEAGNDVEVITRPDAGRTSDRHRGLQIHSCVGDPGEYLGLLLRRRHFDAVVIIGPPHSVFMTAAQHLPAGGPRIVAVPCITPQGVTDIHDKPHLRLALQALTERAEVVVCSSHGGYDARLFGELGIASVYVPNAVHRHEPDGDFRAQYGLPADAPLLLMVGNLRGEKNHAGLLNLLRDRAGDWRLVLIGCPFEYSPHVATHVEHLAALDNRVLLIPGAPPRTVAAAMATADVLLLPSFADATPLVLIEAMSHALAWVATPDCGSAHDHAGGLVLPVADFAPAIDFLLGHETERRRLGAAGRAHWQACYRYDVTGPRYDALVAGADSLPTLDAPPDALAETRAVAQGFQDAQKHAVPSAPQAQEPAISVILRAPREAAPLRRTLDALEKQTLPAWAYEIVVVEDGPRHGLSSFWAKNKTSLRLSRHQTPQTGPAAARNAGLLRARGEIVLFLDDASALAADFLEQHLRAHQAHAASGVGVLSRLAPPPGDAGSVTARLAEKTPPLRLPEDVPAGTPARDDVFFRAHGTSLKRSLLCRYGLWDTTAPDAAADIELCWRLADGGLRLVEAAVAVEQNGLRSWPEFCRRQTEQGRAAAWLCRRHAHPNLPFWLGVANAHKRLPELAPAWQQAASVADTLRTLEKTGWATLDRDPDWRSTTFPALLSLRGVAAEFHRLSGYVQALDDFEAQDRLSPAPIRGDALVSVVVTSYNYGRYLAEAVESVVAQTYTHWELIVVNDGSPDDTQQVAEALIAAHPGHDIRLISQPNSGHAAHARNRGLSEARGQYLLCLDADDVLEPTFLWESVALLQANPLLSIAYTDQERFYEDGTAERFYAGDYSVPHLTQYLPFGACSLFRRSAWNEAGPYKPVGYEDWDFWLSCAERGHAGRRIPKPLFRYRKHNEGKYAQDVAQGRTHKARLAYNHPALFDDTTQRWARGVVIADEWRGQAPTAPTALVSVLARTGGGDTQGLHGALAGLARQTHGNWELILIQQDESDPTPALRALQPDARVTTVPAPVALNAGEAWNLGLRAAAGRYVAYLPPGTVWEPDHLATVTGFLESTGEHAAYPDAIRAESPHFDYRQILVSNTVPPGGLVHEKTCLDRSGPFDPALPTCEDWDLWIRLSRFFDIVHLPQATLSAAPPAALSVATELCVLEAIYGRYAAAAQADPAVAAAQTEVLRQTRERADKEAAFETDLADAERRFAEGDREGAETRLRRLLANRPSDTRVLNDLGVILWNEGAAQDALRHFLQALQTDPDDRATVLNCADALGALGLSEDAGLLLDGFVRRHPGDAEAAHLRDSLARSAECLPVAA